MFFLLNILWFIWILKYVLFWLYLWQLKEYHIGRFVDHFRTHSGKKLLLSFEQILKICLLVFLFLIPSLFSFLFFVIFLIYFLRALVFFRAIYLKSFKRPVRTFKTIFLASVYFAALIIFLFWSFGLKDIDQPKWFLAFDILTPLIISAIVLFFQPFFALIRTNTLKKAGKKLDKIKELSRIKVVAITGSYGKTSTKEFLTAILSKQFKILSTKEHQNSEIGIANCILGSLKPSHQIFIAEVGAYNKGKIKEVCEVLRPEIGIVTGVNEQHLALFGSLKNLLSAEGGGELAECLPKNGLLVLNGDNKYCLDLTKKNIDVAKKIYTINKNYINSDIWTEDILVEKNSISFLSVAKINPPAGGKELGHFNVNVLGKQNVQNLLAAILVARELGMSIGEISEACKNIKQEQAGMVLKHGKLGLNVVDSSYSANPDGVFADLDYFSIFENKKLVVMPCLIELGPKSSAIHQKIGRRIAKVCDLAIITSKDKFEDLKQGFDSVINPGSKKIIFLENPEEIATAITSFCKSGDAVLLEGRVPKKLHELL
ncbi:MAG: hypothetical protein A2528_01650 [Candidatus Staskawiczbacteria bacterium RIFOXYD2_FULL_37_9]|uniref:Uncharacterized protein n=1 Tax=Candidatus Staskawiczbacteria bacterium RIFOXYB1_FULL_37_44 TaxID=1802223 RepID=A0A1G2IUN2_9BACT|nr:MAG: hypothetical protein A2358_03090 [Candidatus Staskawiczbacteria bacterium RIFOXYB1_FULL_37_44]OGZ83592.1 MAG: hypothetical protein A2416_04555 [Candidatus Staskawiczbacteria bacterium RIFOXYC1_FULL_37_52]OGZ88691.1 MAG: hypothetical protein A2581_02810 [Candidatus Staskawiczbacteria bacterium RIFOXYD1_FULL_37_110]OGZ93003.1 MAG: hypothetical protein A2528_01650 [Candidatus Staskawiczbacteria bacterium RIFOXYD2_FULL_37_9]